MDGSVAVPVATFAAGLVAGYVLFRRQPSAAANAPVRGAAKLASNAKKAEGSRGEHKMVLVVRTDLKMGSGKIAAQCGHATLGAYKAAQKRSEADVKSWSRTGQAKVALKCQTLEELHRLAEAAEAAGVINYTVVDAGRTQIEEGSETVLAIGPAPKDVVDKITGHLKLL